MTPRQEIIGIARAIAVEADRRAKDEERGWPLSEGERRLIVAFRRLDGRGWREIPALYMSGETTST